MTEKEAQGFEKSGAADLIADLHKNRGSTQVRQVARALLGEHLADAPRTLDDIDDPAERARAISRGQIAAMHTGEAPTNKSEPSASFDRFIEDLRKDAKKEEAPEIRKTAFADTWLPGIRR